MNELFQSFIEEPRIDFLTEKNGVEIYVKRDDLIDEKVSGNKLFKLRQNVAFAKKEQLDTIVTFGGAFSNHIAATATYGNLSSLKTVGIIRGERPEILNATLLHASNQGMDLEFISRSDYRLKNEPDYIAKLKKRFPNTLIIPEGGANLLGIEGAKEILNKATEKFDYVTTAMGTGTTFAGMVKGSEKSQKIIGLPIHKHDKLLDDINAIDQNFDQNNYSKYDIINGYHFGGYAKWKPELIDFIQEIYDQFGLKLDPIYTGKALFGIFDLIDKNYFEAESKVLFIHTGGLQGVEGFEKRFGLKLF